MKNKLLIPILLIVCIAGFTAVVFLDNHQAVKDFRRTVAQAFEDGAFGIKPFWTSVDEDMIADDEVVEQETLPDVAYQEIDENKAEETEAGNLVNELDIVDEAFIMEDENPVLIEENYVITSGGVGNIENISSSGSLESAINIDDEESPKHEEETENIADTSYDQYMSMTPAEKQEFMNKWNDPDAYLTWYEGILNAHENDPSIIRKILNPDTSEDINSIDSAAENQ